MRPSFFAFFILISTSALAQFNKSDIDNLKAEWLNYASSGCASEQYLRSATDLAGRLSTPISDQITADQAKANDQLRHALSGIREGILVSAFGDKASCPQKIRDAVKKLDSLPVILKMDDNLPKKSEGMKSS